MEHKTNLKVNINAFTISVYLQAVHFLCANAFFVYTGHLTEKSSRLWCLMVVVFHFQQYASSCAYGHDVIKPQMANKEAVSGNICINCLTQNQRENKSFAEFPPYW